MLKIFEFLTSRIFLINLLIAVALFFAFFYGVNSYLKNATMHGDKVEVPVLIGKKLAQVDSILIREDLRFHVIDSVYEPEATPGQVLEQIPAGFQNVKPGRTIYITINTLSPPNVAVPNLKNMSLRQAAATLEVLGFKLHKLEYEPDICTDCVLKQLIGNEEVDPGTLMPKGSAITLVLGQGMGNAEVQVPYLTGLNLSESVRVLLDKSLNVGAVLFEKCETKSDSDIAVVYRQTPGFYPGNFLNLGSEVDLWFTADTLSVERLNLDSMMQAYQNRSAPDTSGYASERAPVSTPSSSARGSKSNSGNEFDNN